MSAYSSLRALYQQTHPLTQIRSILSWDSRVIMSPGAINERAVMMRALDQAISRQLNEVDVQHLLKQAGGETLDEWDTENLRLMGRDYIRHRAIDDALASELNNAARAGRTNWAVLRAQNNWKGMMPLFRDVINAERKKIKILTNVLGCRPYEVVLFDFVRGYSVDNVNEMMDTMVRRLSSLVRTRHIPAPVRFPRMARDTQLKICHSLMEELGFDFNHGRIDLSAKAFHTGTDEESRIGLHIVPNNVMTTISSAVHEMGHALHRLNRPPEYRGQPVGSAGDFAMREAMAFIWQIHACRTPEFLSHVSSVIRDIAKKDIPAQTLRDVAFQPSRSPLRQGADPVSYMLHIAVRTKMEQELLVEGRDVETVPQRWAELYDEYLGVDVPDDANGCLQDIHWYKGAFGYFPAYALGHLNAAAMMRQAELDMPDLRLNLSVGNGSALVNWLKRHVYRYANLYSGRLLVEKATGLPVNIDDFIDKLMA
jgi:carboxypeptidase Taq